MMSRAIRSTLLLILFIVAAPRPADAQFLRPAIGGAVGVAGGAVVTVSIVVARARLYRAYLDSPEDLIHWQSVPMIVAPATGVLFGLAGKDALIGSIVGSTAGMLTGAALGAGIGWWASAHQEGPWAGGVIGAGLGMTIGGIGGGLFAWARDDEAAIDFPPEFHLGLTLPVR